MDTPELAAAYTELARLEAASLANFQAPIGWSHRSGHGGSGKQHTNRVNAALRRATRYSEQITRTRLAIVALGGTVPDPTPPTTPTPANPPTPTPTPIPPSAMTDDELHAADTAMDAVRRETRPSSLTNDHRAVKAELGRRDAGCDRQSIRSAAGKKAAATRARRKAAGLPPLRQPFTMDNAPTGGWTDADRV